MSVREVGEDDTARQVVWAGRTSLAQILLNEPDTGGVDSLERQRRFKVDARKVGAEHADSSYRRERDWYSRPRLHNRASPRAGCGVERLVSCLGSQDEAVSGLDPLRR